MIGGLRAASGVARQGGQVPKFLEDKLKKQYPDNPGAVYGTMNKLGFMHGNKETAAGHQAQAKHDAKIGDPKKRKLYREMSKK